MTMRRYVCYHTASMKHAERSFGMVKRFLVILLAFTLILPASVGCVRNQSEGPESMETVGDTEYSITYFYGPPYEYFNEKTVSEMKDAGFDIIPLQRFTTKPESLREALGILKDAGLDAAVDDARISGLYRMQETPSQEVIDSTVAEVAEEYRDFDNIKEWILCDEPNSSKFEVLGRIVDAVRRIDPDKKTYINLLPNYADSGMLGAATYEEYIEKFCETVKPDYICYDYYDFVGSHMTDSRRGSFLENMETVKAAGDRYGIETRVIVLATQHMVYSNMKPEEIAWQANLSLLYGMKSLSYFTYWLPDDPEFYVAMAQADGHLTQHYYDVQKENAKTRVLGDALYNTSCDRVFRVNSDLDELKGPESYSSYGKLGEVEGSDFLVSFYDNGWFMLMNATAYDSENNVRTLETEDVDGILFWLNPENRTWESFHTCSGIAQKPNGQYEITLRAGDSLLLRVEPVK